MSLYSVTRKRYYVDCDGSGPASSCSRCARLGPYTARSSARRLAHNNGWTASDDGQYRCPTCEQRQRDANVLAAVRTLRWTHAARERLLQDAIAACLDAADIAYEREVVLGPRARIDFVANGGVGIEAKRNRPGRPAIIAQLGRYAASEQIHTLIVVSERGVRGRPIGSVGGKPCHLVCLSELWGVAT